MCNFLILKFILFMFSDKNAMVESESDESPNPSDDSFIDDESDVEATPEKVHTLIIFVFN